MGAISGICRHPTTNVPGAYRVFASDYQTGELYGVADSDPVTGAYSIPVPDNTRVRVVRVNAPLEVSGSSLVLGLPMDGTGGVFEELVGGVGVSAYSVEQAADGDFPAGRCAVFDANGKYLEIGYDPSLIFPGPFTFGTWLEFISLASGWIFCWGEGVGALLCNSSGTVSYVGDDFANGPIATVGAGELHHYLVSRDEAGIVRKFFDGVLVAADESSGVQVGFAAPGEWLGIGRWPGESTTTLRAKMAGFFMADQALYTDDFVPPVEIPAAAIYSLGEPFAASEVADYIETLAF